MSANERSKARYARAPGLLAPITLSEEAEAARVTIINYTGETTADAVRRLLLKEAARIARCTCKK